MLLMVVSFIMLFVTLVFLTINIQDFGQPIIAVPSIGLGIIGLVFFGGTAFGLLEKFKDVQPGLTVNEEGLFENTTFISFGFIPWSDIEEIAEVSARGQHSVVVKLRNPQEYVAQPAMPQVKIFRWLHNLFHSSPVQVSSNSLPLAHHEIHQLIQEGFQHYLSQLSDD